MVAVTPLALRVLHPRWADEVPSPAHDSLSATERRRHLAEHPRSYLGVTRSADDLGVDLMQVDPADAAERAIELSRASLEELLDRGAFGPAGSPRYLLYRLRSGDHDQTGLVCGVPTVEYEQGRVLAHERIDRRRAEFLAHHLRSVGAQSSPIALAFRSAPDLESIIDRVTTNEPPVLDIDHGSIQQTLWSIDDHESAVAIAAALDDQPLYVIDGHHRAAAASADRFHRPDDTIPHLMLAVLFPLDRLRTEAFHRFLQPAEPNLLEDLAARFPTRPLASFDELATRPAGTIAVALGRAAAQPAWHLVDLPAPSSDVPDLDMTRLSQHVLGPVLGIDDTAADPRLDFTPGPDGAHAAEELRLDDDQAVFWMRAFPPRELIEVVGQGHVMPPKSTYFVPKVCSGLFLRLTDPTLPQA